MFADLINTVGCLNQFQIFKLHFSTLVCKIQFLITILNSKIIPLKIFQTKKVQKKKEEKKFLPVLKYLFSNVFIFLFYLI